MVDPEAFDDSDEIAVVGMAGRFPGARNIEEFWSNLRDGVESISFFSEQELESDGVDESLLKDGRLVRAGGVLDDVELFDASFFGFNPREAEITDPQHRLFLECAWEALEHAGYDSARYKGLIGMFAGVSMNTYLLNLYTNRDLIRTVSNFQIGIGNDKDFLATRVSYKLNLKGPSLTVQTACSTSLVAVHLACQNLLDGQCEMALAGGVSVTVPQKTGYFYEEGGIHSPDGHCRAFDEKARGFVSGNGVGIVVLKRLADALRDGDTIHAVIKGSAINNDGSLKVGYTAPSEIGQAEVIASALAMANIEPETIGYIEAHGTGTALGDPIEIAALTRVFRASTLKKNFCAVGSVKTNVGHLDSAAGITGLIKTVLALKHGLIPPSLHFEKPNPRIDFASTPFFVNGTLSEWKTGNAPRRAAVSSFGIGGTNAHVILEEAPQIESHNSSSATHLLVLSAKTRPALERAAANLADYLRRYEDAELCDVAYTLQVGRRAFNHRHAIVCEDTARAARELEAMDSAQSLNVVGERSEPPVTLMFSGQGAQYVNMGLDLYKSEPGFRVHVERCAELLKPSLGFDLRDVLYPPPEQLAAARERLKQTSITQPVLFVIEYALAKMYMNWGVEPQSFIGHSIGEYVAACLAGVLKLEDVLRLLSVRGRLMQELTTGGMLAVSFSEEDARQFIAGRNLSLAAVNGPSDCVIAGACEAISEAEAALKGAAIECRGLETSHAFHSAMMESVVEPFVREVSKVKLSAPQIPYISNVTGTWIKDDEARDPHYWGRHLRETVRFSDGIQTLMRKGSEILLEVGPGQTLSTLARRQNGESDIQILSTLKHPKSNESDISYLQKTLGQLWMRGVRVEWERMYAGERRRRVALPAYPFERERYWIDAAKGDGPQPKLVGRMEKRKELSDWFYAPVWHETILPEEVERHAIEKESWLLFADECGLSDELAKALAERERGVVVVRKGSQFVKLEESAYEINPHRRGDYEELLGQLQAAGQLPEVIVHMWSVTTAERAEVEKESAEADEEAGFYSLLYLAQALGEQSLLRGAVERGERPAYQIWAVSNHMQEVTGGDLLCPLKATILGPCRVIPQEYPGITCHSVDVVLKASEGRRLRRLTNLLISDISAKSPEAVIAYRGGHRWAQSFEPVRMDGRSGRAARLREGGVYLITGGLGGIALEIAAYLARTTRAKLVLVGRTALPAREEWERWLAAHDEMDETSGKMRRVMELEAAGAEVLIASADVSDRAQMRAVIDEAYQKFGVMHGVIHAAGVPGKGLIQLKTRESAAAVLAPKVAGTLVLDELLRDVPLDFFVLFSSLRAVQGGVGHVDYCAANAFMDAFARYKSFSDETFTIAIDWGGWRDVGMSNRFLTQQELDQESSDVDSMSAAQGVEAFSRILHGQLLQVIVAPRDLQSLLSESNAPADFALAGKTTEAAPEGRTLHRRPQLRNEYVAPVSEVERMMAQLWQELLGVEQVGIHDNFFELGGDSILSLRILARANQAGLQLSTSHIFECQTIAELASVAGTTEGVRAEQGLITGPAPLAPVQRWFFEQDFRNPHHWNQSVLLEARQPVDASLMQEAARRMLSHHDALRLRFKEGATGWEQTYTAQADVTCETVDLLSLNETEQDAAIESTANRAQRMLNFSTGPLMRLVAFKLGARKGERLLVVVHHLAIDAVSWRILLEDLGAVYLQLVRGEEVALPPKTTSFKQWSERLTEYAQSESCRADAAYWLAGQHRINQRLPLDNPSGANTVALARTVAVGLDESETLALLQEVPPVYQTQINDVLMTALAQALAEWTGSRTLVVEMEGHARETVFDGVDLTRTVGWFTSVFPVRLELTSDDDEGEAIKSIKEQLRSVPHHGLNYGVLRYLSEDRELVEQLRAVAQPEVGFLYLGQLDQELTESSLFGLARETTGLSQSPRGHRPHLLDINGYIVEGRLQLTWTYSESLHARETVEGLAELFMERLRALIAHCRDAGGVRSYTPSDFPEAELTQRDFERLLASLSEAED
jgi:non-ribosomal peptide synthase protein (TIGR01720 family)